MRNIFWAVLIFGFVGVARAADAPRTRETMDWGWKFFLGDAAGAEKPEFADTSWQSVDLPHDFSIYGDFDQNAITGGAGGYLPVGIGWYRKTFTAPDSLKDKKVGIEFDGIYENSEVSDSMAIHSASGRLGISVLCMI